MIVPNPQYVPDAGEVNDACDGFFGGQVGGWQEPEPLPEKPRRPIGFRMPEREWAPSDPSWCLL